MAARIRPAMRQLTWDLFCRVIDNYGDVGVCLRLGRDLAARGHAVRLWLDDARALAWMQPTACPGLQVLPWAGQAQATPAHVVVETFGCDPEPAFRQAMAAQPAAPVWVNLEYLSAEAYVERSHRLPSPVLQGPGQGLTKWFFYPGFTPGTGGLLREPGLLQRRAEFKPDTWLQANFGLVRRRGERLISLFCYDAPALPGLLAALCQGPTLLLATPGHAARQVQAAGLPAHCRTHALPWLSQADYDHLLWASDFNLVRGEDSFVRAHWAGRPFLWHIYPQHDGAHGPKLQAWLDTYLAQAPAELAANIQACHAGLNGLGALPEAMPDPLAWQAHATRAGDALARQSDLTTQLIGFVQARLG